MEEQLTEVLDLLNSLCTDHSISKNVRAVLEIMRNNLGNGTELGIKIDSALQTVEVISLDPNLSAFARSQIWNLTSMLESVNNSN